MRMELSLPWKFFETVFAQSHDCWRETVMTCRARGNLPGLARCGKVRDRRGGLRLHPQLYTYARRLYALTLITRHY
jgi:hypothetical protein